MEKREAPTLLVGMQTGTGTMENNVEIPLKTGNKNAKRPSNPTAGHTQQETRTERDTSTSVFTAALFTMVGHGSNPDVHRQMNG